MRILVVNDDGIKAPGIKRLVQMAAGLGEVWVVAPAAQCSAMSHRITVRGDLEVKPYDFPVTGVTAYSVGGTPADCVKVALGCLMTEKPDIVFSGINAGYNVGRDILYSGTIGAAMEALCWGVPAIAFSVAEEDECEKAYILAPQGLTDGMTVMSGATAEVRVGNCLPLENIPVGTQVHNVELYPGKGGQLVRSAGMSAQLMAKEGKYATLRLPSGEMRMVPLKCRATIGVIGNGDHNLVNIGKAGRKRHMGVRPTVRGSVMNPNDHPHGGGEGRAPIGRPGPCTPWGKPALGLKTRKKNKSSNKLIVRRRDGKALK